MVRIVEIRERTVPLRSEIRNALISFQEMDTSVIAVVSDVVRHGRPVVGFGFGSNGRYSPAGILRQRIIPRVLSAAPAELTDDAGDLDPHRVWDVAMRNEKPGGHGERSVAVGVLDMAIWDLAAKLAGQPLHRLLAERYGGSFTDPRIFVYAAGGYYGPGRGLDDLADEMRGYLDRGYTHVKMKVGGVSLREDLHRVETVIATVGSADRVAVDANGRFDLVRALEYGVALAQYGLWWYEEPGDPLDFELLRRVCETYRSPVATGENLFSLPDVRNLLRYGGMRPDRDTIQVDPALSYGVVEYVRILEELGRQGWSSQRCIPHGGHQLALHVAAAMRLGGSESYPDVFQPIGGFGDDLVIEDGYVRLTDELGIGIEHKAELYQLCQELVQ